MLALGATAIASFFFWNKGPEVNPQKETLIQQAVYMAMMQAHLKPQDINDDFSVRVYDDFINALDGRKRFMTQEDLTTVEKYKLEVDDLFEQSDLSFFNEITTLVDQRIKETKEIYPEILSQPFDFAVEETIEFDFEKEAFAADKQALKERWQQRLKFYTLQELEGKLEAQEGMDKDSIKTVTVLEEESRKEIEEAYDAWYENYEKVRRSDRFEQYLNAITSQFDPHTDYYSPKGKQDFNMRMGGKLEGIGARLGTVGELTQVASIVPGGPVWKDDQIEVNDYIRKVAQEGEEPIDITGWRIDDVVSKIRGPKGTKVTLTIQKKDESLMDVTIERDVINLEIARARAAVLGEEGEEGAIGYIQLPMFYNSFDGTKGNSSATDVAAQVELLKEKGVNGIILDLRDNLGGALIDAIDISGLFIEEGPVVQVKSRDRRPYVHKDDNESVAFDGPLIVMVNNYSASASEIVAGALQDYKRAIIVGSQTFGKGSVQNFINLDQAIRGNSDLKPLGEVKLTIQKYYRVNGASTQLKGVIPDIKFPDAYDLIPTGERENESALEWSKISAIDYDQNVLEVQGVEMLAARSKARIQQSDAFSLIKEHASWLKENKDATVYSLRLDDYLKRMGDIEKRNEKYEEVFDKTLESFTVDVIQQDFKSELTQEEKDARTESWTKSVSKDIYIEETLAIMKDVLKEGRFTQASEK